MYRPVEKPAAEDIGGEEEKMQQETQKILGDFRGDHIEPLDAKVSDLTRCHRSGVIRTLPCTARRAPSAIHG